MWHKVAQSDTVWHKYRRYNVCVTERKEEKLQDKNNNTNQDKSDKSEDVSVCVTLLREGTLFEAVDDYLELCHASASAEDTAARGRSRLRCRFPNIAGFCRFLGTGLSDVLTFKSEFPFEYDRLIAIFEDEALNSEVSPTLLSAYMKKRMLYALNDAPTALPEEVRYCFEHDIFADGE